MNIATRHPRRTKPSPQMSAISLFSGALGLDLGLEEAGFDLKVAVEVNRWAAATIREERESSGLAVLQTRIEDLSTADILNAGGLKPGKVGVISGGPSCQTFSTAGHRRSLDDDRGWLFRHFLRIVQEAQPRFFVLENVRGVMSAAISHRPLAKRGPGHPALAPEEQHGSAFRLILQELRALGYYVVFGLVDAADYGAAQHRMRLIFIGSRDGEDVRLPAPTHGPGTGRPHRTLRQALDGLDDPSPLLRPLPPEWAQYLALVPEGGNWRDLPADLQEAALGAAYRSWGGRNGFFRRLAWDKPTPALTTNPAAKATMLGHPTELRTLSVREVARLQGFPDQWAFQGGAAAQFSQVGNAVPVPLGAAVGRQLAELVDARRTTDASRMGTIACEDGKLIERYNARPRTVLNPSRMREIGGTAAAREWMEDLGGSRRDPIDDVIILPTAA